MQSMTSKTGGPVAQATDSLKTRLEAGLAALNAWRARRADYLQTVHELSSLDNRELADLGIARCDIPRVAREATREV